MPYSNPWHWKETTGEHNIVPINMIYPYILCTDSVIIHLLHTSASSCFSIVYMDILVPCTMRTHFDKVSTVCMDMLVPCTIRTTVPEPIHATKIVIGHRSPISFQSVIDPSNRSIKPVIASHDHRAVTVFYCFHCFLFNFTHIYIM